MIFSREKLLRELPLPATAKWPQGVWDVEAFRHGTMSAILFTPRGKDYQTWHEQDELYFVMKGRGTILINGEPHVFGQGDAIFVKAMMPHHFEDFSDDLELWAVFWGPAGGEVPVTP